MMRSLLTQEIAATAARLIVEEGLEYGPAKRRAARELGQAHGRGHELPSNETLEEHVREYLALFCADSQPLELKALREIALSWMERLVVFRPHLTGAVWRGTATRLNDVHLQLFCDDSKAAEIELLNQGIPYAVGSLVGSKGQPVDVLSVNSPCAALNETVTVHLSILDHDDLRGGLKPDGGGRTQRGDAAALQRLLNGDEVAR